MKLLLLFSSSHMRGKVDAGLFAEGGIAAEEDSGTSPRQSALSSALSHCAVMSPIIPLPQGDC